MRNAMPMRWIEQAEARQVLAAARFERAPQASWRGTAGNAASQWLARARSWIALSGLPMLQVQPALVGQPAYAATNRRRDADEGYASTW